jgi:hypothetical protein
LKVWWLGSQWWKWKSQVRGELLLRVGKAPTNL